jgi:DTW domain-containing protein YfiP
MPESGQHLYRRERPLQRADVVRPGKELWILHPLGEPLPTGAPPENLQVLLIDGSWRQALDMMRVVEPWGRRVSLPMAGESRYWLRAQHGEGRFSTLEALLFLLAALGCAETCAQLRLQFELHVYAGLCARGKKSEAADFLATSPVREGFPDVLAQLAEKRPRA